MLVEGEQCADVVLRVPRCPGALLRHVMGSGATSVTDVIRSPAVKVVNLWTVVLGMHSCGAAGPIPAAVSRSCQHRRDRDPNSPGSPRTRVRVPVEGDAPERAQRRRPRGGREMAVATKLLDAGGGEKETGGLGATRPPSGWSRFVS